MEKKLGLHCTTDLINCHRHHKVFNALCKSTVNLAFLESNLREQEYRKLNRLLRMRLSGKKQDSAKKHNG